MLGTTAELGHDVCLHCFVVKVFCLRCLTSQGDFSVTTPPWCNPEADLPASVCVCVCVWVWCQNRLRCLPQSATCSAQCQSQHPVLSRRTRVSRAWPLHNRIRSSQCHSPSHSLTPISSPRTCIRVRSSLALAFATRSTRFAGPSPLAPPLVHRHKHPHQRDGYRAAADPGGGDWGTRVARLRDGAVRGLLSREYPLACDLRQKPSAPCTCYVFFTLHAANPPACAACFRI